LNHEKCYLKKAACFLAEDGMPIKVGRVLKGDLKKNLYWFSLTALTRINEKGF
jgi:hypothetical protein